ncbi:outer membrane protein assembly factor BamB family protein [Enhygromyxa salina]|uniref:Pyrrolo-quinoline quinone repeat domain-containing protein n=1 Tax=Enhygromyxa salina TaxID=215803 RepID=A0A2S9XLA3_9BACT|nr:PQQ-binding-like beta-propeller repeat protein [Enhygromyxa salina]PRP93664.1 hypothetical protein ENSA7_80920 [Enhygromyxa salina]
MAIVKLVCQGCGANLDATDDVRMIACGYCGTTNQIKQTVHQQPAPPPRPQPQMHYSPPPIQVNTVNTGSSGGGKAVLIIVLLVTFVPLVIGAIVAYTVFQSASAVIDQVKVGIGNATASANARKYMWKNGRPFVADVNGDGVDDLIGTISESGSQQLVLTAMSGSDWKTLWEVDLGRMSELPSPTLYFEPGSKLVLFGLGATLHAYDAATGTDRWLASMPDKLEAIAVDGDHLWVATIDDAASQVTLAEGKLSPGQPEPPATAKVLRDDAGYDLIPELRQLDLKHNQFQDLRVQQAFCPEQDLPIARGRRHDDDAKRCANPHGIAFVTRDKGTQIPYFLGYARDTKAELWRVQLTKPGSLETVESGFAQPRVEIIGDDAIVSFVPSSDSEARIRRISLADGSTKWETRLGGDAHENVEGMVVGDTLVIVTYGQSMRALSLETGEELAKLGGW